MKTTRGWYADDGNAEVHYPDATSGREAAEEYVAEGDWGERTQTSWVRVHAWQGERGTDLAEETWETHTIAIEPIEPDCSHDDGHDWRSPVEIVGGIKENPGVWGKGGGVVIHEVCVLCGCRRTTDSWAQDPDTGEQGLTSVEYEEGYYVDELEDVLSRVDVGDLDQEPVGSGDDWSVFVAPHPWGRWATVYEEEDAASCGTTWHATRDDALGEAREIADNMARGQETAS